MHPLQQTRFEAIPELKRTRSGFAGKDKQRRRKRLEAMGANWLHFDRLEDRRLMAADVVVEWNEILLDAIRSERPSPPIASRSMAIVHVSVFDAVNSIFNHYFPYGSFAPVHPQASAEAAAASAAARSLTHLFPALHATFATALENSLAAIPDGIREDQGVETGRRVADAIFASRATDGWDGTSNYTPGSGPGRWQPTEPAFAAALLPHWGDVRPWVMTSDSQFRAPSLPALDSPEYAAMLNQVKDLGSASSSTRTADQADIAKIWAGGPGTATPPGQWNMIAQEVATTRQLGLYQSARLFAKLNIAMADAAICAWDSKFMYDFWRPLTAIRSAGSDGNPGTEQDDTWTPLITTPPFPAYTSGHSTFSGAASTVLAAFFGTDQVDFTLRSEMPGVADRPFTSFSVAAEEAGISRIYGGIHFGFDNDEGLSAGRKIGALAVERLNDQPYVMARLDDFRLYVSGTLAADQIGVFRENAHIVVRNRGRIVDRFDAGSVRQIYLNGSAGNDFLSVAANVAATAEFHGGQGNDILRGSPHRNWMYAGPGHDSALGGSRDDVIFGGAGDDLLNGLGGNDLMFGGAGDDSLSGFAGRDILAGGLGTDWIRGGNDDDLVIGGHLSYGSGAEGLLVQSEWLSDRSYETRVTHLLSGTGPVLNGTGVLLQEGATVLDDGIIDLLFGEGGTDWFHIDSQDTTWDRVAGETLS